MCCVQHWWLFCCQCVNHGQRPQGPSWSCRCGQVTDYPFWLYMRVVVCLHVNLEKVEGFTGKYKFSSQYACFVGALSVLRIYAHPLCDNTTMIQLFTLMCAWFYAFTSRHWQDLGYLIIYITGRPDMQKQRVVSWLSQHNFPHGMIFFSEGLVHDPLRQKTIFLRNLIQEVNPDINICINIYSK